MSSCRSTPSTSGSIPARIRSRCDNAEAIAENWQRETAANPALFDGTVVLLSQLA